MRMYLLVQYYSCCLAMIRLRGWNFDGRMWYEVEGRKTSRYRYSMHQLQKASMDQKYAWERMLESRPAVVHNETKSQASWTLSIPLEQFHRYTTHIALLSLCRARKHYRCLQHIFLPSLATISVVLWLGTRQSKARKCKNKGHLRAFCHNHIHRYVVLPAGLEPALWNLLGLHPRTLGYTM